MKVSEHNQAMKFMTRPDGEKTTFKPTRANMMKDIIVNPLTRDYENTAYSIEDSFKKHIEPQTLSEIEKYYSKGDRIAQKGDELLKKKEKIKEDKLLKYVDDIKNGDYLIYEKSINDMFEKEAIQKEARKKIEDRKTRALREFKLKDGYYVNNKGEKVKNAKEAIEQNELLDLEIPPTLFGDVIENLKNKKIVKKPKPKPVEPPAFDWRVNPHWWDLNDADAPMPEEDVKRNPLLDMPVEEYLALKDAEYKSKRLNSGLGSVLAKKGAKII